ncbi:DUF262 domain-containing protein [uncultured Alcanivorax sp.]|uniref:DUF262 domain-containing protein n=1 Tax=uncultured Alcanivorax sp. TaxID=191215 RepID=UPI0026217AA4|nr:DUF262 domain-containing protein [uncultured Alcanivorax sp.]
MSLENQVSTAKQEIVKDGLDMSLGEIMRIYERDELIINPAYQRLFRWDDSKKTKFIESLILGIPVPPIFVFTDEKGRWELIDGLQRLSTVFEYAGILKNANGDVVENFLPSGTQLLPDLDGKKWYAVDDDDNDALPIPIRLDVERARLRVEILKRESDQRAKYELFQRLNTGGAKLSPQEVRNCVMVMLNASLYEKLEKASEDANFISTTTLTRRAISEQRPLELLVRFIAYRYKEYRQSYDIHDWLDEAVIDISTDKDFDIDSEIDIFHRTFNILNEAAGDCSFKKFNGSAFERGFLISAYEAISIGVSRNIQNLENGQPGDLLEKIKKMWADERFTNHAQAGVRGTTRLANLLPIAHEWFE